MRSEAPPSDTPSQVATIEQQLAEANMSVNEFCRRARINRATWQRWKAGKNQPHPTMWGMVENVLQTIPGEAA